jgi:hypothetical protein
MSGLSVTRPANWGKTNWRCVEEQMKDEVAFAVQDRFLDSFLQRLEGWWYRESNSNKKIRQLVKIS